MSSSARPRSAGTPRWPSALVVAAACQRGVLALLIAAGLIAVGLPAGGSFALGLAIGSCGLVFAAVAAVAAQLTGTARGARGLAIAVLGGVFVLQSAGAAAAGPGRSG